MNSLEHPDPFVAYQASEALYEYINIGYANHIADVLHHRQTRVHETSNTNILELLHVMLKHIRKQLKSGSDVDPNYVITLLQLFPVFNKQSTDHFNAVSSPSVRSLFISFWQQHLGCIDIGDLLCFSSQTTYDLL